MDIELSIHYQLFLLQLLAVFDLGRFLGSFERLEVKSKDLTKLRVQFYDPRDKHVYNVTFEEIQIEEHEDAPE